MKRFEIWLAQLPVMKGSHVQCGCRPVVVISNDCANANSPVVTVVPMTMQLGMDPQLPLAA
jgi:mRNA interferase MazF